MLMRKLSILILTLLMSCYPEFTPRLDFNTEGYTPVYAAPSAAEIKLLPPQVVKNPGKIYVYRSYLLVNEVKRGIHIFNNINPSDPQPVGFIEILGNTDMAIKDNVLYADHMGNLVALKTEDFSTLEKTGELPISRWQYGVPPPGGFYFECVNEANGIVVSWKKTTLKNPDCYAYSSSW